MILCDVNIFVYAHREDSVDHERYRTWLEELLTSGAAFGVAPVALNGFLRIVTHPAIFKNPSPLPMALDFAEILLQHEASVHIQPGPRHWSIFARLCRETEATGNLIPDAWLAALAMEHACEWMTTDRDYQRFPGLRQRHPLR